MRLNQLRIKANVAHIVDYLKDFDKTIHLTDRQKAEILGHRRDKDTGAVTWPSPLDAVTATSRSTSNKPGTDPSSLEDDLAAAELVASICASASNASDKETLQGRMLQELKTKIIEKHKTSENKS